MPSTMLTESTNKRKSNEDFEGGAPSAAKKIETEKTKSPHDAFFDKKTGFMEEKGYIGSLLVKGIPQGEEDEDEDYEEEEEDTSKYTEAQMSGLRFIMITKNREDKMDEMRHLILGEQADERLKMFNTSYSNMVHDSLYTIKSLLKKAKTPADKFDLLLGYTYTLKEFDVWMYDNEGDMDVFTKGLASIWKRLLKTSDADLGIDAEYTRPALEEFLQQFKNEVEGAEAEMKFNYK